MDSNKQLRRLKLLFFIRYLGDSFFFSFLQLFLAYKSLSESDIGFINSLRPMLVLFMNPFFGFISKDVNMNRKIMRIITIIEGVLIAFITKFDAFIILTILVTLISMLDSPFYSLLDGFSVSFTHIHNNKYSNLRILGSLAYVFGNIIGGLTIDYFGYEITFFISALFMISTGLMVFFIKPLDLSNIEKTNSTKSGFKDILKNHKFYIYLVIYIGIVTTSGIGDNFISLYFLENGLGSKEYGLIASLMIIVEVITMFIYNRFSSKRLGSNLYFIIGITYALRSICIGLNLPLYITIPASLLRGVAWGLILCIHVNQLRSIVGTKNITNALFLLVLISSIIQMVSLNVAGNLLETKGYAFVYFYLAIITLITSIFALFYNKLSKKNQKITS